MGQSTQRTSGKWQLVYIPEPAELLPGVAEIRARWLGKSALCSLSPGKWQWVKVHRVTNDGIVVVAVVRGGVLTPLVAFDMQHIPLVLKSVDE